MDISGNLQAASGKRRGWLTGFTDRKQKAMKWAMRLTSSLNVAVAILGMAILTPCHAEEQRPQRKDLPDSVQLAWLTLEGADQFSFGPVGFGGATSSGELAARILANHPQGLAIFKIVATEGKVEGKLYALAALHALDRDAYKIALAQQPPSRTGKATLMNGCDLMEKSVGDLLVQIEAGAYDTNIPRRPTQ